MTPKPEDLGFSADRLDRVADICHWYVDEGKFAGTSALVARRGEVVFRDNYGMADIEAGRKVSDDTIWRIYSMTKPIASIALMQLVERGQVLLTNPVHRFIPSFKDARVYVSGDADNYETEELARDITILDILTHMSGLGFSLALDTIGEIYRKAGLGFGFRGLDLPDYCDLLASLPLAFQPGTRWKYSAATDVVGRVVEVVSGQTLDAYLEENIFGPLRMTDTAFWVPEDKQDRFAQGYRRLPDKTMKPFPGKYTERPKLLSGAGGLVSTMDDYHRFATALLRGGELDGARIIGRKTLEYMTMNHLPGGVDLAEMAAGESEVAADGVGFGLGFGVVTDPPKLGSLSSAGEYMWGGAASTAFWVDPAEEITVVFMTQLFPSATYPIRPQLRWTVNQALL